MPTQVRPDETCPTRNHNSHRGMLLRGEGAHHVGKRCVIAEVLVEVFVEHGVAGTHHEGGTQLQRTRASFVLFVSGFTCPVARLQHARADHPREGLGAALQRCHLGSITVFVDEHCEGHLLVIDERLGVHHVAGSNGDHIGSGGRDLGVVVTQLRGMLSAEHSTEMTEEDEHDGLVGPVVTEAVLLTVDAIELDISKLCGVHEFSLSRFRVDRFRGAEASLRARHARTTDSHIGTEGLG